MFRRIALLADEAGDGDKGGGGGAPAGGSPEGGQDKKPEDGEKLIPESRIRAALLDQERRLRSEFEAKLAEAKPKADPPKRYTRAELKAAVETNQISQDQADSQWELQVSQDAEARAERVALHTVSAARQKELVDSEIGRYKSVAPEILDDTHETRQKIQQEYSYLTGSLGQPAGVATQLAAIRAILGPIDKLERARSGRFQAEHHRETGGGGEGGGGQRPKTGGLWDQLTAEAKAHYEKQIDNGLYKDKAEVEAELKFASPGSKRRLGIA